MEAIPRDREESWFKKLGPGLITGAADDDPSGIATYSQAGALFGFNMLWTVLFTYRHQRMRYTYPQASL